jgi:hypothetical protein
VLIALHMTLGITGERSSTRPNGPYQERLALGGPLFIALQRPTAHAIRAVVPGHVKAASAWRGARYSISRIASTNSADSGIDLRHATHTTPTALWSFATAM